MKKRFKTMVTALCIGACLGSFALGSTAKASADLTYTTMEELVGRTPECALVLEEAKVKNMTDFGYYNVDGEDVWYFYGDGTASANPEIRFITDGTQTKTKPYTFAPITVERFSFSYRISNDKEGYVQDVNNNYIVQILSSDGTYPIIIPNIKVDNAWHTITIDASTPIQNGSGRVVYGQVSHLFAGFIFKMGKLDGDFMISNIELIVNGATLPSLNPYEEPMAPPCEMPADPETSEEELPDGDEDRLPIVSLLPEGGKEESADEEEEEAASDSEERESAGQNPEKKEDSGCGATVSGAYALFALAGAGFVMAIRKKKE